MKSPLSRWSASRALRCGTLRIACLAGLGALPPALAGCSSASSPAAAPDASTGDHDATASNPDSGMGDADAAPSSCAQAKACPASTLANSICVVSVQADLVDSHGAGIAGQQLLVCGDNLCSLPGKTDSQGSTTFVLCQNMVAPALKFLGGASYVSFAAAVSQANTTFAPITLVPLPSVGTPFPAAGGTVASGQVTLQVASGAVAFDSTQPSTPDLQVFRAAHVDLTKPPPALPTALGLKDVWGLAPVNATLMPAGTLTIPNTQGWPAGAKVDVYMNGVEPVPMPAVPYGAWGPVGTATVSQDGKTISTDTGAGNGIPILGMVGVRLHQ